jgi:hypothetical protein
MTISEERNLEWCLGSFLIRLPWHEGAAKSSAGFDQTTSALFHIETLDSWSSNGASSNRYSAL